MSLEQDRQTEMTQAASPSHERQGLKSADIHRFTAEIMPAFEEVLVALHGKTDDADLDVYGNPGLEIRRGKRIRIKKGSYRFKIHQNRRRVVNKEKDSITIENIQGVGKQDLLDVQIITLGRDTFSIHRGLFRDNALDQKTVSREHNSEKAMDQIRTALQNLQFEAKQMTGFSRNNKIEAL